VKTIDYVVANHAEQDHSGAIPRILELHPEATVLCTPKCKAFLMDLLHMPAQRVREVADGESVSLGDRNLRFIHFPWVHWPETMLTWVPETRTLLSCDLFGSHLASSELFVTDGPAALAGAKRYYAEIIDALPRLHREEPPQGGGPRRRRDRPQPRSRVGDPKLIIDAYKDWMGARRRTWPSSPTSPCTTARGAWPSTFWRLWCGAAWPWSYSTSPARTWGSWRWPWWTRPRSRWAPPRSSPEPIRRPPRPPTW